MSAAPLQFLLLVFAGWVNRRQREVVEYLQEENRVLREQLGDRRLRFTDDQRRRLAAKGRALGGRVLNQLGGLVTPIRSFAGTARSSPRSTTAPPSGRAAGPARPLRCNAWSSSSPPRTRAGVTRGSVARSATSVTNSGETRSSASSQSAGWNPPPSAARRCRGRPSSGRTSA
jgi:hypothetical protein